MVTTKTKVAVAMSGGIDSSVAAAILKQQGFDVAGVTMFFSHIGEKPVKNAKKVTNFLGIKHYRFDLSDILEEKVISNFCREYLAGRTPNPCVRCNQYVKFGVLLREALKLGFDFMATGHYVRKTVYGKQFFLRKGVDNTKDQSYFLYRLKQKQLKKILFPLGELTKQKVKIISKDLKLPVTYGSESQEVCFLLGQDYRKFLKQRLQQRIKPGLVINKAGDVLGKHQGSPFYTLGQREGLNIALGYRAYVTKIDAIRNQVVLGERAEAASNEFIITRPSFILQPIKKKIVCFVKVRYNQKEAEAQVCPIDKAFGVTFKKPQFAITPGQAAVFYDQDKVIGGGIIKR